ncbi:MAG: hypothetical protein JW862_07050 [Anaerolineales bacterium]|nr:hypothetical protein [Anaerolineales bacterium]
MLAWLKSRLTAGGLVSEPAAGKYHLSIPAGDAQTYRLAQLDDYHTLRRKDFPWQPGLNLSLRARLSQADLPGTWGFGFWNDPSTLSLGFGGGARNLPQLPQAAWFFHASQQNYLSLRHDLPARGFLAQTFRARRVPATLLVLASPVLPALLWRPLARRLRALARPWIQEDATLVEVDVCQWHTYSLTWEAQRVRFEVDDWSFETPVSPSGPLGLVIWIDNQYLAFNPEGRFAFGYLDTGRPAWLEIEQLEVNSQVSLIPVQPRTPVLPNF